MHFGGTAMSGVRVITLTPGLGLRIAIIRFAGIPSGKSVPTVI